MMQRTIVRALSRTQRHRPSAIAGVDVCYSRKSITFAPNSAWNSKMPSRPDTSQAASYTA
jgi:hypothetical protein